MRALFFNTIVIIAAVLSTLANKAHAAPYLTSDFDSSIGFTSLNVRVGESYLRTLESTSTIELNYNMNFSGSGTSVSISAMEILKSELGNLPLTRLALAFKWYPFHLNGERKILDTGAQARVWRATPFIATSFGATTISIKDVLGSFNAFIIDAFVKAGVEVPMATDWLLIGQFGYIVSLLGTNVDPNRTIGYNGISLLLGFKVNTF